MDAAVGSAGSRRPVIEGIWSSAWSAMICVVVVVVVVVYRAWGTVNCMLVRVCARQGVVVDEARRVRVTVTVDEVEVSRSRIAGGSI